MTLSLAGIVGAAIGLYLGWVDYKFAAGHIRAWTRNRQPGRPAPVADWVEGNMDLVQKVLFAVIMLGFPAIGYLAGASLAG